jgi:hypothetical protein
MLSCKPTNQPTNQSTISYVRPLDGRINAIRGAGVGGISSSWIDKRVVPSVDARQTASGSSFGSRDASTTVVTHHIGNRPTRNFVFPIFQFLGKMLLLIERPSLWNDDITDTETWILLYYCKSKDIVRNSIIGRYHL